MSAHPIHGSEPGQSERLLALRARFVQRAGEDRDRLNQAFAAGDNESVRRIAHGLAGIAGSFGFDAIGDAAARIEEKLDEEAPLPEIAAALDALSALLARAE